MNKELLATILGVAGLSLLKKVSGSNSKLPKNRLGTILFILKPDLEELDEEYEDSDLLSDFYSILVDFVGWNKKYGRRSAQQILFEDNGLEFDENGDPVFPQGESEFIRNIIDNNFEVASAIEENWYPVYNITEDIFRILNNVSRGFLSVRKLDNSIILEVNVVQLVENMDHKERGKINTTEEILNYIKDCISSSIEAVCYVLGNHIYQLYYVDVDVECAIEMIAPLDKLWLPSLLIKSTSELRRF